MPETFESDRSMRRLLDLNRDNIERRVNLSLGIIADPAQEYVSSLNSSSLRRKISIDSFDDNSSGPIVEAACTRRRN
jgi:hypothetical protein